MGTYLSEIDHTYELDRDLELFRPGSGRRAEPFSVVFEPSSGISIRLYMVGPFTLFEPPYARDATPYSTLTLISLVLASSVLGSLTSKTPFLKEALILSACTSLGSSTDRRKAP